MSKIKCKRKAKATALINEIKKKKATAMINEIK